MKGRTLGLLVAAGAVLASYAGASVIAVHPMSASLRNGTGDKEPRNSTKDPRFFLREASSCGSVAPGAHTLQAGESIDIGSPGFPGPYSTNLYMQWVLSATSSDDLTISCNIQGIKGWRRCKKGDKLIVRDGCRRRRLCPKLPKQYFKVTCQNTATITFRTNGAGELGGFCCTVTANVPETTTTEGSTQTEAPPSPPPQSPSPPPQTPSPPPPNSCPCGVPNRGTRIVGGVVTEKNEYPWLVALSNAGGDNHPFCGGSVYNSEWVVTAAHCVDGRSASGLEILYNMWDWTDSAATQVVTKPVAEIIVHPQYDDITVDNDIALIRVSSAVDLTLPGIMPVCLPSSTDNYAGQNGIVTGWGTLSSGGDQPNQANEVTVPIRPQSECVSSYPSGYITSNMICAGLPEGGIDSCQGDSGGPLTVDVNGQHHLAGIVSWGIGCADAGNYGVYTDVPDYVTFIENNANTGTFC
ncbi:serine protease 42-like [Penaeus japonicus]|uniref:serine protease 42-like n=1 Tax=Penaeus japonicus TaxID=27405 RepID=UPI001C70DD11|nr:serine protease 42-like [Penaeus japonicus]